jgi:mono/diheme cytochrome c family protein
MRNQLALAAALLALAACGSEKKSRGIDLLPDMFNTPAYKSQTAGTIEVDARDAQGQPIRRIVHAPAMLTPPVGTVPRGQQPYPLAATDWAGAKLHRNPLAPTPAVLKQGQRDFLTFCAPCHGRDGNAANGYVAKTFSGIPSLNGVSMLLLSDGEVFHTITMGKARMWNLRAQLPPERRWSLVHFVKLQARAAVAVEDLEKLTPMVDAELAKSPNDRRAEVLALAAQAKSDLAGIQAAGDGNAYIPPPPAVPEYVGPAWPVPEDGK